MKAKVGDIVVYTTFTGSKRKVKVENVEDDIKNGFPGFTGTVLAGPEKGMPCWGYDDQINTVN